MNRNFMKLVLPQGSQFGLQLQGLFIVKGRLTIQGVEFKCQGFSVDYEAGEETYMLEKVKP